MPNANPAEHRPDERDTAAVTGAVWVRGILVVLAATVVALRAASAARGSVASATGRPSWPRASTAAC